MSGRIDDWRRFGDDLGPRAVDRSRASLRTRWSRLERRAPFILQIGVGAGIAWLVAHDLLGHRLPFFAPITAAISLGMSYGQRLRRVYEVVIGVALGVFLGDVVVHLFGSGVLQLVLVCMASMTIATLVGAGLLMTTQAGVQSIVVVILVAGPSYVFSRWLDALVGGAVAIVISLLFPGGQVLKPRRQAARVVEEIGAILRQTAAGLRAGDTGLVEATVERARASESMLEELREAADEGMAVVRLSLIRRRHLPGVMVVSDLLVPLDRAVRNLRVLVRRAGVADRRGHAVPAEDLALLEDLADLADDMARVLHERGVPQNARHRLIAIAERSSREPTTTSLDVNVIRAQVRSMVADLLMLTGLTYAEAFDLVPPTDDDASDR